MPLRSSLRRLLAPTLRRSPLAWAIAREADVRVERARFAAARYLPVLVSPQPRQLQIAVTALCNLRCVGCRYGREFMPGQQLPWDVVNRLLEDARDLGFWEIRLYGGEPLLHPDLPRMVARTVELGMEPFVTTNAVLLADRIDALYDAGLRRLTVGFYGTGAQYDEYVGRRGRYDRVEAGIAAVRDRYGMDVDLRINWLLSRPSCTLADLDAVCAFADRYDVKIQVDLVHYSLPYFTEGPDRMLQFRPEDRPAVEALVDALCERKAAAPDRFSQSLLGLRSIPEWLLLGPDMRVPCDAHQMIWVGADGSVQLCYVTFPLGNLHERPLRDLLRSDAHRAAARDAYALACPNCHCRYDVRVEKHPASAAHYTRLLRVAPPGAGAAASGAG